MIAFLRSLPPRRRTATLLGWGLLIASPFLLLAAVSLVTGRNAFATYPVWSDELDYWRNLFTWDAVGFHTGYNGLLEEFARMGTLGAHGFTAVMLYGWFVKLFGLGYHTIVLANAVWVSLGAAAYCGLMRPRPARAALLSVCLMLYAPAVLYCATSMTEMFNYALMLFYLAFLGAYRRGGSPWALMLACLTVTVGCLYRITYFLLFIPVILCFARMKPGLRMAGAAAVAAAVSLGCYLLTSAVTAPYTQGFLYHLMRAPDAGTFVGMLLSHTKSNLMDCFVNTMGAPMEHAFRWLYLGTAALCLAGTFVRPERGGGGLRLRRGFQPRMLGCFALLAAAFSLIVVLYETNDWSDLRTLSPFLWLTLAYLVTAGRLAVPRAAAAGMAVTLALMLALPPTGMFAEPAHFEKPEYSEDLAQTIAEYLVPDPDAQNPLTNTLRLDVGTLQAMEQIPPEFGLQYGWFTTESTGKSRWILTDHLKCAVNGYERLTDMSGYKVYRLIESYEE